MVFERHVEIRTTSEVAPNSGQSINDSSSFMVPACVTERQAHWVEHLGHDSHQAKPAEKIRGCAFDGPVRPLALSFKAEVSPQFFIGDFDVPTKGEPDEYLPG